MKCPLHRRSLLAVIHVNAKQHGISDEDRKAMQERLTGHDSCSKMSDNQLSAVILEMQKMRGIKSKRENNSFFTDSRQKYIYGLWSELAKAGTVSKGNKALNSFIWRQTGANSKAIARLQWLKDNDDYDKVIHALKAMGKRVKIYG